MKTWVVRTDVYCKKLETIIFTVGKKIIYTKYKTQDKFKLQNT
jgi:hypothetical protein